MPSVSAFFFFNDTATTEIYTLSLHDALPISLKKQIFERGGFAIVLFRNLDDDNARRHRLKNRSEEHTSELQSHLNLVCRLLLEKKKNKTVDLSSTPPTHILKLDTHHRQANTL